MRADPVPYLLEALAALAPAQRQSFYERLKQSRMDRSSGYALLTAEELDQLLSAAQFSAHLLEMAAKGTIARSRKRNRQSNPEQVRNDKEIWEKREADPVFYSWKRLRNHYGYETLSGPQAAYRRHLKRLKSQSALDNFLSFFAACRTVVDGLAEKIVPTSRNNTRHRHITLS